MNTYEITGAPCPFLQGLEEALSLEGLASAADGPLDCLFLGVLLPRMEALDCTRLAEAYQETAIGLPYAISGRLDRMAEGGKRICLLLPKSASINCPDGGGWERVVYAACNMAMKTAFNRLRPLGYTFRVYGITDPMDGAEGKYAAAYCLANRSLEEDSPVHSDENRLVMRDFREREIPW